MNLKKQILASLLFASVGAFAQFNVTYFKDGPYVFHHPNTQKIIVKSITSNGIETQEYNDTDTIIFNVDDPTSNKQFSVTLRNTHAIEPETYTMPDKIFFTSDIEGQFGAFKKMLIDGGVMNQDFEWTYGNGHLYCIGDMLDRGEHVTEVLWLIYRLEEQAKLQGGKVHYIMGNHEIMCIDNDQRYVADKYKKNIAYLGLNGYGDLFNANAEWGKWYRSKNIIEKIGDYTVVHAGVSPEVANLQLTYRQMNDFGRVRMEGRATCNLDANCAKVTGGSSLGLYWYRSIAYVESPNPTRSQLAPTQAEVENILQKISSTKTIFGHTLTTNNTITPLYQGKAINIDVNHATNIMRNHVEAMVVEGQCFKKMISDNSGIRYENLPNECIQLSTVNNNPLKESEIYPNPSKDMVFVRAKSKIKSVELYDMQGRKMNGIFTETIDNSTLKVFIENLFKGNYVLVINYIDSQKEVHQLLKI